MWDPAAFEDENVTLERLVLALEPLWPQLASSAKSVLRLTSSSLRRMVDERLQRLCGSEAQVGRLEEAGEADQQQRLVGPCIRISAFRTSHDLTDGWPHQLQICSDVPVSPFFRSLPSFPSQPAVGLISAA